MISFPLLLVFFLAKVAVCGEYRIANPNNFNLFATKVNRDGTNFYGTTVYLDSDLTFSVESIPVSVENSFRGTFDGQGHVISNFNFSSSSYQFVGLFGFSTGSTIRNVILDDSCSIKSDFVDPENEHILGGIIGYCVSSNDQCLIENSINMAKIIFSGNIDNYLFFGGIFGYFYSNNFNIRVSNCANYGQIINSGKSLDSIIGGIAGFATGSSSEIYVQNSLNYGPISCGNETVKNRLFMGGILGYTEFARIENCVSGGEMIFSKNSSIFSYVGSIVGFAVNDTHTSHSYFSDELGALEIYGGVNYNPTVFECSSYNSTTFKLSQAVSIGNRTEINLVNALNALVDCYDISRYSRWVLNKDGKNALFAINNKSNPINLKYTVILFPSLAKEGDLIFDGWYTDPGCSSLFTANEIADDVKIYGIFGENTKSYAITFDTRGGTPSLEQVTARPGANVALPSNLRRRECTISFWETECSNKVGFSLAMPARNITLYAVWKCEHIRTPEDFLDFSKIVNTGTDFYGSTVFLESDLSLSAITDPVGKDTFNYFSGTFDGQGHVISDFRISKLSTYVGVFGYSTGMTIRNVVVDDSCSVTCSSKHSSFRTFAGGVLAWCYTEKYPCSIESNVNMASIVFDGEISSANQLYLGGVVGCISAHNHPIVMKNCANYGTVSSYGVINGETMIGGVVGTCGYENIKYVQNCLNYGAVIHNGITGSKDIGIGGITGFSLHTDIENCVSVGKISTSAPAEVSYNGAIAGKIHGTTSIHHCFWTSDAGSLSATDPEKYATTDNSSVVVVGSELIENLNGYSAKKSWNKWLLNANNASISFKILNNEKNISVRSQVVLLPDLVDNGVRNFNGWYRDETLTEPMTSNDAESDTSLYGAFCGNDITVTLDHNGGSLSSLSATSTTIVCDAFSGELPSATRTGHSFDGWFTERAGGYKVEASDRIVDLNDFVLYAHWTVNKYYVTFNFDNGTEPDVRAFEYNTTIIYPTGLEKAECTFSGWENRLDLMPAQNFTVTAQWVVNKYYVTFNFDNGTEPDVRAFEYNTTIIYPTGLKKTGCTFSVWENRLDLMPAQNFTVTAQWVVNKYYVTFNFDNETEPEVRMFEYNASVKYPSVPGKSGWNFTGWDSVIEFMPAHNLTVNALWSIIPLPAASSSKTGAIVGGVVGSIAGVAIIAAAILLVLIFLKRGDSDTEERDIDMARINPRIVEKSFSVPETKACSTALDSVNGLLAKFYPAYYRKPSIAEALSKAGLSKDKVGSAINGCASVSDDAVSEGKLFNGFTKEDAEVVALYTFDFGGSAFEENPYRIINKALTSRDEGEMQKASGLLFLVMSSLRKLPRCAGKTLYRGVREGVDVSLYEDGATVVWRGLSSTSPDMKTTKAFLEGRSGGEEGTLFVIEDGWGYDIQPYSFYPEEEEILLEPERSFLVQGVIKAKLTVINLKMIDSPLILPQVFGGSSK